MKPGCAKTVVAVAALALSACLAVGYPAAAEGQEPASHDRSGHVVPLRTVEMGGDTADLAVIGRVVGSAPVIGFGEGWHHTHEFLTLRNRLFAYMVENLGVTAYAGETGFARGVVADDYVMGQGALTADVAGAVFYNADLEENRQLLEWMREYNRRPGTVRPVRFYGIDVSSGRSRPDIPALALEYLATSDPQLASSFTRRLQPWAAPMDAARYAALAESERDRLTAAIADLVGLFDAMRVTWVAATSDAAYQRAYRSAVVALQADTHFRTEQLIRSGASPTPLVVGQQRDAAMAANVRWALEREGPHGRVFVFAHNWHVDKFGDKEGYSSMGAHLRSALGERYKTMGSLAGHWEGRRLIEDERSPFLRGVDRLRRIGLPVFMLDEAGMKAAGIDIGRSFDAIFFVRSATACRRCDTAFPYLGGALPTESNQEPGRTDGSARSGNDPSPSNGGAP